MLHVTEGEALDSRASRYQAHAAQLRLPATGNRGAQFTLTHSSCVSLAASLPSFDRNDASPLRDATRRLRNHFFFEGDPAGGLALANPPGVVAGADFTLSFFGFLASLLLRI